MTRLAIIGCSLAALLWGFAGQRLRSAADAPEAAKGGPLVIVDGAGKEQKIKAWKFSQGTRHLTWLAPTGKAEPEPKAKDKNGKAAPIKPRPAIGPEALEFRDEHSTNFVDGVLTLVPLDRIRSLDYDADKQAVTLKVLASGGGDETLTGTTKFRGINKLTIEAEVDKGDMGVAEIKFLGGVPKGIRSLTFPAPKAPAADKAGRTATLTIADKQKIVQKAQELLPLYRLPDGSERLLPTIMFKKTLKVDIAKVTKLHLVEGSKGEEVEWVVTTKDGEEQTLTLLKTITLDDKQAVLEGFLGRVPAGYKLFPPHTISEIQFEEAKAD
jgi:hypothetical protein